MVLGFGFVLMEKAKIRWTRIGTWQQDLVFKVVVPLLGTLHIRGGSEKGP